MKKTMLNIASEPVTPARRVKVARTMGTDPPGPPRKRGPFPSSEPGKDERKKDACRTGGKHEECQTDKADPNDGHDTGWKREEAEGEEHGGLAEPGVAIEETQQTLLVDKLAVTGNRIFIAGLRRTGLSR